MATTWMKSPEDGEAYPADTPTDVVRKRSMGYEETEKPQNRTGPPRGAAHEAEKPAPTSS